MLDYELEFGVILGKGGKNIAKDKARAHIFGYLIFNDVSARDIQMREMQGQLGPTKGKDFDTGNILGPWLVTADEVPDPYNLTMVARVNGEEWSRGNTGTMHHKFEDMIAHASADETLHRGRVPRLRHGRQRLRAGAGDASSNRTTWSSWRSTGSACCATGS